MKIIIDIPDKLYNDLQGYTSYTRYEEIGHELAGIVKHKAQPLPANHGALVDRDAINAQEPKIGHWIKYDKEYFTPERWTSVIHSIRECSECHKKIADFCGEMKFCFNCGVKMEVEE